MDQCPPGTGAHPLIPWIFWGSIVLALVLIVVRVTVLSTIPERPPPRGQFWVVVLAILSPCGGFTTAFYGILYCSPLTQSPQEVCQHFAEQAQRSRAPVGFDEQACREIWTAEQEQLSGGSYRELSSCVMRTSLETMHDSYCIREGFDLARHAPGSWPTKDDLERGQAQ